MSYECCERAGCGLPYTHLVELTAADGQATFRACREHALAFQGWVAAETERQGGTWSSALVERIGVQGPPSDI